MFNIPEIITWHQAVLPNQSDDNYISSSQPKFRRQDSSQTTTSNEPTSKTVTTIRLDKDKIWIPEIEIVNRVYDFSPRDELKRKLRVDFTGEVTYDRMYRVRTMMSSKVQRYPYDIQVQMYKCMPETYSEFSVD